MSTFKIFCKAFGEVVCSPCLICYWLITDSDKEQDKISLVTNQPENYGTSSESDVLIPRPVQTANPDRATMLWDYTDIMVEQQPIKNHNTLAIVEEEIEEDQVKPQNDNHSESSESAAKSAFKKPDYKDIQLEYPSTNKKSVDDIESFLNSEKLFFTEVEKEIEQNDAEAENIEKQKKKKIRFADNQSILESESNLADEEDEKFKEFQIPKKKKIRSPVPLTFIEAEKESLMQEKFDSNEPELFDENVTSTSEDVKDPSNISDVQGESLGKPESQLQKDEYSKLFEELSEPMPKHESFNIQSFLDAERY